MPNIFLRFRFLILFRLCFKVLHHFSEDWVFFLIFLFLFFMLGYDETEMEKNSIIFN